MFEHHDKDYWLYTIKKEDQHIVSALSQVDEKERKEVAENIIVSLRHFVQNLQCYIREVKSPEIFDKRYKEEEQANSFCKANSKYNFLSEFLDCLNSSIGHQSIYGEYAERLIQKYFYFLIRIKKLFADEFNIKILDNLEKYPIDLDNSFFNYYKKIINGFNGLDLQPNLIKYERYYVQKKKIIFIDDVLFYEYTLTNANDNITKFDRFSAFSLLDIFPNYCIKAKIVTKIINYLGVAATYFFIVSYEVSIRKCEFEKLDRIFRLDYTYNTKTAGYRSLMTYIKENKLTLNKLMNLSETEYKLVINSCFTSGNKPSLLLLLNYVRKFISSRKQGWRTVSYLLYHMNNSILNKQLASFDNELCFGLHLTTKVYPFELNPFSSFLYQHQPSLSDICNIFSIKDYRGEYLARTVSSISNNTGVLFLPYKEILSDEDEPEIKKYNSNFEKEEYFGRKIIVTKENVFLKENKDNTEYVISEILKKSKEETFPHFCSYAQNKIDNSGIYFDDKDKENAVLRCFDKQSVFIVYGPAGSGKSYFAKLVVGILPELAICCIAMTNPAVDNMRQKIGANKAKYSTISKYLSNDFSEYDLLIIDECSTISTKDMKSILEHGKFKMLLLCGDIFQIPSIKFGNWFSLLRFFVPSKAIVDFNNQFRSNSEILKRVWHATRNLDKGLQELLDTEEISHELDNSIFEKENEDEIVLCLNYDGLYGINNINKILQCKNTGQEIRWKQYIFKVNDPILFYETERFSGIFYNNLKGKILDVYQDENSLYFKIKVFSSISTYLFNSVGIDFFGYDEGNTLLGFSVKKPSERDYDQDYKNDCHIPFQIAYAVSIHKAQGLEFESVKIVISNEVEEIISHNIFYTAITRAKRHLIIYWTANTERNIINNFCLFNCKQDAFKLESMCANLKIVNKVM